MTQYYSNPKRESETYALPNVEVFYAAKAEWAYDRHDERCDASFDDDGELQEGDDYPTPNEAGFYYWYCLPGCLPDSDPYGPYETEALAVAAMREENPSDDEDDDTGECATEA